MTAETRLQELPIGMIPDDWTVFALTENNMKDWWNRYVMSLTRLEGQRESSARALRRELEDLGYGQ